MADTLASLAARLAVVEARLGITPGPVAPPPVVNPPPVVTPPTSLIFPKAKWLNWPIVPGAATHPQSAAIAKSLVGGDHILDVVDYGTCIVRADESTPRTKVAFSAKGWGSNPHNGEPMPIPPGIRIAPGDDGHVVVLDDFRRLVWSLYQARDAGRTATWGSVVPYEGDGVEPPPMTSTGSRLSRFAGVITEAEMIEAVRTSGYIPHALFFSSDVVGAGKMSPAGKSDQDGSEPLVEGMRLYWPASISAAGLNPVEAVILRTGQKYGFVCGDGGGAKVAFICQYTGGITAGWKGVGVTSDWYSVDRLPWGSLVTLADSDGQK